jgi:hypothetical protein
MKPREWQLSLARGDDPPVSFQAKSHDRKLSPVILDRTAKPRPRPFALGPYVSSTYTSILATCPDSCTFKRNGCYGDTLQGYNPIRHLEERAKEWGWGALETTLEEAEVINAAFSRGVPRDGWRKRGRDLRLHVLGDVSCKIGATALAHEAKWWGLRGGGAVWTYTHRWRDIPRANWGSDVSVIASVETAKDIVDAHKAGYGSAITLVAFPDHRRFPVPGLDGFRVIPCPAETRDATCVQCRLCMKSDWLHANKLIIGFAIHGRDSTRTKHHLRVLQGSMFDSLPLRLVPP